MYVNRRTWICVFHAYENNQKTNRSRVIFRKTTNMHPLLVFNSTFRSFMNSMNQTNFHDYWNCQVSVALRQDDLSHYDHDLYAKRTPDSACLVRVAMQTSSGCEFFGAHYRTEKIQYQLSLLQILGSDQHLGCHLAESLCTEYFWHCRCCCLFEV